ncbi:MAG: hypothetical protein ACXWV9_09325, partial [Flavisolibacter sp.]
MKKIILLGFILLLATQNIFAQISGVKTIPGDYPSITQALMQIQTVGISGPVFLELQNGYSSSGETFPIKIREYAGSAAYPLTISPAIDATDLSIFSTSSHSIIEFIGAYNVTIDGRPGRTGIERELSIRGLSTDNKVISFLDGAVSNTVTYCDVLSSVITSSEFDPDKNVVFFGRSTEPVPVGILLENSNNTLSDCNVVAFTSAYSVIYAKSISSDVINAGNNIINNEIRNFYSSGIQIGMNGGSNWNITGNSIYNLNSNISTGQYGIAFDPGATSVNNTISGNYIGGRASLAQGNPMISKGIFAIYVASASSVIIENNTIKNIRLEDNIGDPLLIGINIQGNTSAQIRSNHIGGSSEEDGIVMYGSNLNENQFVGIGAGGCFPVSIENNRISNITMQSTGPQVFIGIGYKEGANTTITGNQIDQVTATSTGNIVFSAISAFSPGGCPVPPQPAVFDQNLVHNITLSSDNDD